MAQTATLQIEMPEMGESVTEGIVLEWHVAEGDFVNEGDTVVEISTDKVDAEVPAPTAGTITRLIAQVDEEVPVGAPLAEMTPGQSGDPGEDRPNGSSAPPAAQEGTTAEPQPPFPAPTGQGDAGKAKEGVGRPNGAAENVRATPLARRVADATGVDLETVSGSGPGAKVTKGDVLAAANGGAAISPPGRGEAKALRGPAAMLAQAMNESLAVPTATSFRTIAVDTLDAKRKALNGVAQRPWGEGFLHPPRRLGAGPSRQAVAGHGPHL